MIETISMVNREVARRLGQPEGLVKMVNQFFWRDLKKEIASGQRHSLWLRGLGTLVVSRYKVNQKIRKLIWEIRYSRERTFERKDKEAHIKSLFVDLGLMLERRNEVAIIYKRNADRIKAKTNLGKQTPDTTRNSEQVIQPTRD